MSAPPPASAPDRLATTRRRARVLRFTLRSLVGLGLLLVFASLLLTREAPFLAAGLLFLAFAIGLVVISRRDALAILTLLSIMLFLLPENYVLVGPLKSAGNPALLVGVFALGLWAAARVLGLIGAARQHPVRWAIWFFAVTSITAYLSGALRPLTGEESSGASRAVFPVAAMIGIGLLACDALESRDRVETMLERLVLVCGIEAGIGIIEFANPGFHYVEVARLPGLTTTTLVIEATRSGFARIDGAAAHPIEFAVALAVVAPIALHLTLQGRTQGIRRRSGLALVAMLVVIPMSVSRSGLLAIAVGLLVYSVHLSGRSRLNLLILGVIGLVAFRAVVPGLLGTLRSLVFIGEKDPSIQGRTEDYSHIPGLISGHLWFGRGLGTFQPLQYFYLDNQLLGSLLEGGVLGLSALLVLFVTGTCVARGVRHRSTSSHLRGTGQALAASIAALGVAAITFDELSFHQTGFLLFLLIGCAGALWTATRDRPRRKPNGQPREAEPQSVSSVSL